MYCSALQGFGRLAWRLHVVFVVPSANQHHGVILVCVILYWTSRHRHIIQGFTWEFYHIHLCIYRYKYKLHYKYKYLLAAMTPSSINVASLKSNIYIYF